MGPSLLGGPPQSCMALRNSRGLDPWLAFCSGPTAPHAPATLLLPLESQTWLVSVGLIQPCQHWALNPKLQSRASRGPAPHLSPTQDLHQPTIKTLNTVTEARPVLEAMQLAGA